MVSMNTTHNEGKSVADERFIKTLKTKIYKYITSILKNAYIDKLDNIVNKYNNPYHRTIKMKPVDVKDNTHIDFSKGINNKDPKFKIGEHQNTKTSLLKDILENGLKKFCDLKS